tara:strand:- start:453 stop:959 length:507 start_codon:yes stop_codon:yes gene_type:complete
MPPEKNLAAFNVCPAGTIRKAARYRRSSARQTARPARREQAGFGLVAALFLIVIVMLVVMAMARMSLVQHGTNSLSIQQARAYQAARAGIEWGLSRAVNADSCASGSLAFAGSNLAEFSVVVSCSPDGYTDVDGQPVTLYRLESIAQNGVAGSRPDYAYRRLSAVVER